MTAVIKERTTLKAINSFILKLFMNSLQRFSFVTWKQRSTATPYSMQNEKYASSRTRNCMNSCPAHETGFEGPFKNKTATAGQAVMPDVMSEMLMMKISLLVTEDSWLVLYRLYSRPAFTIIVNTDIASNNANNRTETCVGKLIGHSEGHVLLVQTDILKKLSTRKTPTTITVTQSRRFICYHGVHQTGVG